MVDTAGSTNAEVVQLVYAERPDGITSFFDGDLHRHAWLAAALDLPGPSTRTIARLTDKLLQREALGAAGVPIPQFVEISDPADEAELKRLSSAIDFPLILKPRNGTACRDVSPVDDAEELARLLGGVDRASGMLLEERMADLPPHDEPYADRLSIDSIVSRGVISHVGITGLFPMLPPFRSSGGFFPADVPESVIPELFAMATAVIESLGSDFGCYRTEIKLSPDGRKIIEVNGRPTGLTPATVRLASGIPLLELCMRLALGEHVVFDGPVACERIAYRYYCEPPISAVRLAGLSGLDTLSALPGVVSVDVHKAVGDPVDWRNGSLDKIFQVTGTVADYAELAERYRACTEDVSVTYEHRA